MSRIFFKLLAIGTLVFISLPVLAEDTDLFVGVSPTTVDSPNVLIILDNTANWSSAFTNERAALATVLAALPVDKFNVGLMMFTETGGGNSGNDGGYVRAAIRPLNSNNKILYSNMINGVSGIGGLNVSSDKSNSGKFGLAMYEAYQYFAGGAPYAGNNKDKADYTGNLNNVLTGAGLLSNALNTKTSTLYNSPIASGSCAKNFIIYISNGAVQESSADIAAATGYLNTLAAAANLSGSTPALSISPSGSQDNVGDELARFMKKSRLGITTYTIDVDKVTSGQGPGWSALLNSAATVSDGQYFAVSSAANAGAEIIAALGKIFSEIQDVDSAFAAVSLPISVNTQGTFLNQVYVGMFRPDSDGLPRWSGNLKQYKLGLSNSNLQLQDADSNSAINPSKGFITSCARSFWTPSTLDSYWAFNPQGACTATANSDVSNSPDGNIVEKGAQAYKLRSGSVTRTIKTCSSTFASCTALLDFNNTNVSQANLDAASTTERDALINWEKGLDVDDENINGVRNAEIRASVHGDIVHSRPVAINFGTDAAPQVVVFYGANDGMLHAVNGNRTAAIGSVPAGGELWAFVAPESFANIKRERDNTTAISFFGTTVANSQPKPYGIDGAITALKTSTNTYLYATMRRGGRVLYAFDVTNPSAPTLKWKVGCPNMGNDTDCSSGFSGIGQTWSAPKVFTSASTGAGAVPMIIFGGGYDNCEDADPNSCTSPKGNKIYILNANTGALLKTFDTTRGVIGDVFVVPDSSGFVKYAYAADLGGNIYRITMDPATTSNSTIVKIASLGCNPNSTCTANRKFMFSPDVVVDGDKYNLMLGSGDREKPLPGYTSAYGVSNYFFMVQDNPTDATWLTSENTNCGANLLCLNSLLAIPYNSGNPLASDLSSKKGWYLGLAAHEQVVTSAITVFDVITFSTQIPAVYTAGQCTPNLGTATVYNISRTNAAIANGTSFRGETIAGGGLPPSPVAGIVRLDDGSTSPFIMGGDPTSPLQGRKPKTTGSITQPKARVYWYIEE